LLGIQNKNIYLQSANKTHKFATNKCYAKNTQYTDILINFTTDLYYKISS